MKNLNKNERVAVVVAVFVVGFFFIFGQTLVTLFNKTPSNSMAQNSQLMGQDILVGIGDEARVGSRVVVHYVGKFVDGKEFDSSIARNEPFQFVLGGGQVIKGWDEGVVGMRVGGKRMLVVPPELGYGMQDYGPIPGGSTLIFEIELLKVE
jgi:FKBP-type peptidyl-prolyl cis-trans isomerase FkpA